MKKLINAVDDFVPESLEGLALVHGDMVAVNLDPAVVYRTDAPRPGKVGLVSGGGSGHEPMHGGFVGLGMLDAACPGAVFTSPTPDQMEWATNKVDGGAGVLHIVKNYSGDVMNFEMAADLARDSGKQVASVTIDDDVAVKDSLYTQGRRGVGGTVLLEKLVGAKAEEGANLDSVTDLAKQVINNVRSMGLALSSCTVPAAGTPTFDLGDDEVEIGIGIHGEPGRERIKMESADQLTDRITRPVIEDLGLTSGERVLAFVNSMGGTPLAELYVVYRRVYQLLDEGGVRIDRNLIGPYITSLEMQGASVTILRLDDELTRLWDAPVVVSHSAKVAEGVVEMAAQMAAGVRLRAAGGTDEGGIGTDATLIAEAIADADDGDGVLVFADLGSAVLSAQLAIDELVDEQRRGSVRIAEAPLVEGAVIAAIQASIGSSLDEVDAAARGAASMGKVKER